MVAADLFLVDRYKVWHSYGQLPGAPYDGMFDASVDPRIGVMRMEATAEATAASE